MRIALDAMGGDYAPGPNILGALEAVELNPGLEVLLVGDRVRLEAELVRTGPLPAACGLWSLTAGWVWTRSPRLRCERSRTVRLLVAGN